MRPNTAPYERLGRYFVAYLAQLNISLVNNKYYDLYDNLSYLTLGFSALPKGLRGRMLGEFADYVVSDILVWIRGKSLCFLWSALFYILKTVSFLFASTSIPVSRQPSSHVRQEVY
jgi:hypothetical protein